MLTDVLAELRSEGQVPNSLGPIWHVLIQEIVARKAKQVQASECGFSEWNSHALSRVVEELVSNRIFAEGGREYILAEATSINHVKALVSRMATLTLTAFSISTKIERIYEELLMRMRLHDKIEERNHFLGTREVAVNELADVLTVEKILMSELRTLSNAYSRQANDFPKEVLDKLANRLLEEVSALNPVTLRKGLGLALTVTNWPSEYLEEAQDFAVVERDDFEDEANFDHEIRAWANEILIALSFESKRVLVAKAYGITSSRDLAQALGTQVRDEAIEWDRRMVKELSDLFAELDVPETSREAVVMAMCGTMRIQPIIKQDTKTHV